MLWGPLIKTQMLKEHMLIKQMSRVKKNQLDMISLRTERTWCGCTCKNPDEGWLAVKSVVVELGRKWLALECQSRTQSWRLPSGDSVDTARPAPSYTVRFCPFLGALAHCSRTGFHPFLQLFAHVSKPPELTFCQPTDRSELISAKRCTMHRTSLALRC